MKRIPFYIAIALMLLLTAAIIFWHRSHNATNINSTNLVQNAKTPVGSEPPAPSNSTTNQSSKETKRQIDPLAEAGITPDMTQTQREQKYAEWYIKEAAKLVPEQKPFALYGRVVDENTQAVVGASVHFILSTTLSNDGVMDMDTSSDSDGNFSLTGKTGSSVSVSVWKKGYYAIGSRNQTELDTTGGGSSKENPVLFYLRKKGDGVNLVSVVLNAKMPRDGTPVNIDLLKGKVGASGQLQISQVKPPYESWKKADAWSFQMTIPDGGFVEESEEFPFEAPINGYVSTITFDFRAGQPDWKTNLKKSYYIVFGTPPCYGRIVIENDIMWDGAHISYSINPDGSRNLESK